MQSSVTSKNIILALDIIRNKGESRKTISDSLKISLSDAGMLASKMISLGIIKEYNGNSPSPGRKPKILFTVNDPVFAVSHIFPDRIVTDFFGFGTDITSTEIHRIDDPLFLDDVFTSYFRNMAKHHRHILGICLVSDGIPDGDHFSGSAVQGLDGLNIKTIAEEHLPGICVSLENRYACALSDYSDTDVIITDEYGTLRTYILCGGKIIGGRMPARFFDPSERRLATALRFAADNKEYTAVLAKVFCDITDLFSPERIFFRSGRYSDSDELILRIAENLTVDFAIPYPALPKLIAEGEMFDLTLPSLRKNVRNSYICKVSDRCREK